MKLLIKAVSGNSLESELGCRIIDQGSYFLRKHPRLFFFLCRSGFVCLFFFFRYSFVKTGPNNEQMISIAHVELSNTYPYHKILK